MNEKIFKAIMISLATILLVFCALNFLFASIFAYASFHVMNRLGADSITISISVFFSLIALGEILSMYILRKQDNLIRKPTNVMFAIIKAIWISILSLILYSIAADELMPDKAQTVIVTGLICSIVYNCILFALHLAFCFKRNREGFARVNGMLNTPEPLSSAS
jgi:hypothetical protein